MLVGERGFEPPAPASRRQCSTRLSYSPTDQSEPGLNRAGGGRGGSIEAAFGKFKRREGPPSALFRLSGRASVGGDDPFRHLADIDVALLAGAAVLEGRLQVVAAL